ncbi:Cys/Met metabolism pyridoxal-phosphate-dependent protein [Moorena producens PAL-8-15-08-1]|uniref:homocysteine desulfhydrase n=1 Tax=Moorena producens PAL-8-15-08-1 TaxID=1458985 RepID=A0A1D8U3K8_9CYAN|nr:aminotransferase class I/II-fold pyridoxal phosphate-dependent enzyme [Moorena producens]AOX04266.1 Cys/Met metabolism pyridoxal-phosphate-dependent protein [Moorena producens PAL-8-15-08-1]
MSKQKKETYNNSCITPIYQNAAYFFENTEQVIKYHQNQVSLGRYGRYDNPNWLEFESKIAALDNYEYALIFSSGMNAIVTTVFSFIEPNDILLYTGKCYRNIRKFFNLVLPKFGVKTLPIDQMIRDDFHRKIENHYQSNVKIVFVEMPSNPHLYLVDLATLKSQIGTDTLLIVDSTLSTPYNIQPQRFGADLTIHSCSKYIGGHGDILAGSVAGSRELIEQIRSYRNIMGGIADPHCAFLLNRSLDTLKIRMKHFNEAGIKIAKYLEEHPRVKKVFYTGLESHPHSYLAKKYLMGHGGLVSFELDADREVTSKFVDALRVPFMGTNFGSNNAMVEQCSVFTYYQLSPTEKQEIGITDSLIRLSIGYEDSDLVIKDIDQALKTIDQR